MSRKVVHVIGTGTIGEPLIGALCDFKEEFGIHEITFHKRSPYEHDRPKIRSLESRGAQLAVDKEFWDDFEKKGFQPQLTHEEALEQASVVIDCTPVGNKNKELIFKNYEESTLGFIAQGSEFGFGKPYARGINDEALEPGKDKYIQVVSCNTHNLAVVLQCFAYDFGQDYQNLDFGNFVCMRRCSDISQSGDAIASPEVGKHSVEGFGTHHARDAFHLFQTIGVSPKIFSSAVKLNTQYMHILHFHIRCKNKINQEKIHEILRQNPRVALTKKRLAAQIFSFGRDHGHYGRILNQTVIPEDCLAFNNDHEVIGFCFTPQDGNSLLSSISAALWFLDPKDYESRLQCLRKYFFEEV
ncbi:MAG: hypothetical protein D6785_11495 [Planctomycetota bacterium]|nr:MAG: hypothetical protein D6785_11495 [Planctomycetota bacterium]